MNELPPFMATSSLDSLTNENNTAESLNSIFKSASLNERCLSSSTSGYNTSCSINADSLDFSLRSFPSQISTLENVFDEQWSATEQLTAIVKLVNKLNSSQTQFISTVLKNSKPTLFQNENAERAHNLLYLNKVAHLPCAQTQLEQLNMLLPLLSTDNRQVIEKHLQILQGVS